MARDSSTRPSRLGNTIKPKKVPKLKRFRHKTATLVEPLGADIPALSDNSGASDALARKCIKRCHDQCPSHPPALRAELHPYQFDLSHPVRTICARDVPFPGALRFREQHVLFRLFTTAREPDAAQLCTALPWTTLVGDKLPVL